jgi:predicted ribosome quality control (RQC) complex YloA/Tae2 family protein
MSQSVVSRSVRKSDVLDKMASSYEENKKLRARVRRLEEQESQKREVSSKEVEELHRDATAARLAAAAPRKEAESLRKGEYLICRVFSTIPSGLWLTCHAF